MPDNWVKFAAPYSRSQPGEVWIPKTLCNFFDFHNPEFHPRHPVKYFCSQLRPLFKTLIIEQFPKLLYKDIIGA